jgi:hypothetical protein
MVAAREADRMDLNTSNSSQIERLPAKRVELPGAATNEHERCQQMATVSSRKPSDGEMVAP